MARLVGSLASVAVTLAACTPTSALVQVRDDAGLFSGEARTDAEIRLRELTEDYGIIVYILTHPDPDPPRVLDEPMADAESRSMPAVALVFGPGGLEAFGQSRHFDTVDIRVPSVTDAMLADGRADMALDVIVDHVAAWMRHP
ncbi:MAG TPA: hypothetical protein VLA59_02170 [Patescibacteria group bacterium]|nr:hypothetical protein [Patescibacteria group bacterium]